MSRGDRGDGRGSRRQVIEVESGGTALEILARGDRRRRRVNHVTPKMKGVELAVRARPLRPDPPIPLITGICEAGWVARCATAGIILRKPFKAGDLPAKLAQITGRPENGISWS